MGAGGATGEENQIDPSQKKKKMYRLLPPIADQFRCLSAKAAGHHSA
jgi:hypothetical protein